MRSIQKFSGAAYAVMRIVVGMLFTCHGARTLFGVLGGAGFPTDLLSQAAGIIEFLAGVMIMLGLYAGYAAFIASGEMAFAYFLAHARSGFWPIQNHGELAVLYCFTFLYMSTQGSGQWSVESLLKNRSDRPKEQSSS